MDTHAIAEALIGKGVRAYDEKNDWSSIVIPVTKEGVKCQRIYIKPDGTLTRGSDYKRTGALVGPALALWGYLKGLNSDDVIALWADINVNTPRKGAVRDAANGVSAEDVLNAFDAPVDMPGADTQIKRSVVTPVDLI